MVIGRVSGSMEALAAAVNPHKDLVRDTYETTMKPDDYVYPSENYNDIMKVSAGEHSSSSNNNRQPQ